jgi:hypothetical protein
MENADSMKTLFIIVNRGFGGKAAEIANEAGAEGAVIINAVGTGMARKSLLGIPVESDKEIVMTFASAAAADNVAEAIKEKSGVDSPAHGICLIMPLGKITTLNKNPSQAGEK